MFFKQQNGEAVTEYNTLISKDPVIGFLVISRRSANDDQIIDVQPIEIGWEAYSDPYLLKEDEKIIGILPAPPGSYVVYGLMPNDTYEKLGHEFPGSYHPDWLSELMKRRAAFDQEHKG